MRLVGFAVQGIVLAAVVLLGLIYQTPLRRAFDLPDPARESELLARMDRLGRRVEELASQQAEVAGDLAQVKRDVAALATRLEQEGGPGATARLRVLERLVSRVESKVDDVRDAQLFPGLPAAVLDEGDG